MKHIIVGTAGHVDHGKSTLIRALTGINPDRLKEEQQRGLTIDIGFAYFDLPSGRRAGIVDVPGHEKFVKNMLAGAIGFDVVILVIAADEGIMPQTREHLNILSLLDVKKGIVALSKVDMVEEEWVELISEEIREQLEGTFLEKAPIVPIAALKGEGLDILGNYLDDLTEQTVTRNQDMPFRLPIDRSFPIKGFGTVVTGTLMEGTISVGDIAEIQPLDKETKIRNIQVHGDKSKQAFAGQRVALNLADVTVEECERGEVLAKKGLLEPTMMLDVSFKLLKDAPRPVNHWDRVRVHIGTSEVLARIALIGKATLLPGEEALLQLRLEEKVAVLRDDHYVLRSYSPIETIGGGKVIDPNPTKKKRFSDNVIEKMELKAHGSLEDILLVEIKQSRKPILSEDEIVKKSSLREPLEIVKNLVDNKEVGKIESNKTYYFSYEILKELSGEIVRFLKDYHKKWPLRLGVPLAEGNSRFAENVNSRIFQELITEIEKMGLIVLDNNYLRLKDHKVTFEGENKILHEKIIELFRKEKYSPPEPTNIASQLNISEQRCLELVEAMNRQDEIVKINQDFYLLESLYKTSKERLVKYLENEESIDLGEFRNLLDTSRKYALPLLEHFDYIGLTKRRDDNTRVLN
ncbi:MAG: selenocysteine-specific translation elongation factor [Clostridia bacterium]